LKPGAFQALWVETRRRSRGYGLKPGAFQAPWFETRRLPSAIGQLDSNCTCTAPPYRVFAEVHRAVARHNLAVVLQHPHLCSGLHSTPGCQLGYMDHTGCHQSVFFAIRPTKVVTPGCQIGYKEHTGCHQLVFGLQNNVKSANPTCTLWSLGGVGSSVRFKPSV
jgi:hypothetical protein